MKYKTKIIFLLMMILTLMTLQILKYKIMKITLYNKTAFLINNLVKIYNNK